jgi:transposase
MPTIVAKQYNPTIKAFYDRLVAAGKLKMVALIASLRKLLTILNIMIRDGKTWNRQPQHGLISKTVATRLDTITVPR